MPLRVGERANSKLQESSKRPHGSFCFSWPGFPVPGNGQGPCRQFPHRSAGVRRGRRCSRVGSGRSLLSGPRGRTEADRQHPAGHPDPQYRLPAGGPRRKPVLCPPLRQDIPSANIRLWSVPGRFYFADAVRTVRQRGTLHAGGGTGRGGAMAAVLGLERDEV